MPKRIVLPEYQDVTGEVSILGKVQVSGEVSLDSTTITALQASSGGTLGQATSANSSPVVLASDQPVLNVQTPSLQEATYTRTGTITVNTDLIVFDCKDISTLYIQCTSFGVSGTVQCAWSNDNVTWITSSIMTPTGTVAASITVAGLWSTQVLARYFRLRNNVAFTGGTTTFNIQGSRFTAGPLVAQPVTVSGTILTSGTTTNTPVTPTTTFINSAATTNATAVKTTAGTVWGLMATNTNAAVRYLKLYNKATTAPTVGADVPVLTIPVPALNSVNIKCPTGFRFSSGIGLAVTVNAADSDTTAVAASEIKIAISFT